MAGHKDEKYGTAVERPGTVTMEEAVGIVEKAASGRIDTQVVLTRAMTPKLLELLRLRDIQRRQPAAHQGNTTMM
jgi:hypothetical protein